MSASPNEKIKAIEAVEEKGATHVLERSQAVEGKFETVLNDQSLEQQAIEKTGERTRPTLEEVAREQTGLTPISTENLIAETQKATQQIAAIKSDLETPNLIIKKDIGRLMESKLTHVDDSLKVALTKAGTEPLEVPTVEPNPNKLNPVTKFFDQLSHAQFQLEHLGTYLDALVDTGHELSPANMLSIQIKVNRVQQELEFFTSMLNKCLESTKAVMNVQV